MYLILAALFVGSFIFAAQSVGVLNTLAGTGIVLAIAFYLLLPFVPNSQLLTGDPVGRAMLTVCWAIVTVAYRLALGDCPAKWVGIWQFAGLRVGLAYQWGAV